MKVIGLTGGIGMGKSACAGLLKARSVPVVDTDELARNLVRPGEPALKEIAQVFGPNLLNDRGELRRSELARLVFPNPSSRQRLEAILHPRIREQWRGQVELWRKDSHAIAVVVIPLLFETHAEQELDATICVACSGPTQIQRLKPRGWSAEQIEQRIAAQLPIDAKMSRASFLIWNEAGLDVHAAQLDRILKTLSPERACNC